MGNPDRRANGNPNGYADSYTNANGNSNGYADSYTNTNCKANPDATASPNTETAPLAGAAPIALAGIVKARTPERNSRVHRLTCRRRRAQLRKRSPST
jgi:hypothetical protein